jgi:hypothetical protein
LTKNNTASPAVTMSDPVAPCREAEQHSCSQRTAR